MCPGGDRAGTVGNTAVLGSRANFFNDVSAGSLTASRIILSRFTGYFSFAAISCMVKVVSETFFTLSLFIFFSSSPFTFEALVSARHHSAYGTNVLSVVTFLTLSNLIRLPTRGHFSPVGFMYASFSFPNTLVSTSLSLSCRDFTSLIEWRSIAGDVFAASTACLIG